MTRNVAFGEASLFLKVVIVIEEMINGRHS
jgi:hypothetical protein